PAARRVRDGCCDPTGPLYRNEHSADSQKHSRFNYTGPGRESKGLIGRGHQDRFAPDWTTMTPSRMSRTATASAMSRPNWLRVAPETSSSDPCRRLEAPGPTHSTSAPAAPAAHTDHCSEPPLGTSPAMSRRTSTSVATA